MNPTSRVEAPSTAADENEPKSAARRQILSDALRLGFLATVAGTSAGCTRLAQRATPPVLPENIALPSHGASSMTRLLNRAGFGPCPGEVARVTAMGKSAYLDEQLGDAQSEDFVLKARLQGLDVLRSDPMELRDLQETEVLRQLQCAAIVRALYSKRQLYERMVDFWGNHFNIYSHKGLGIYLLTRDNIAVVRTHALGRFPDLLRASAHSPAMLGYLDSGANVRGVPNENYARELMELHTLGVKGGYTQRDVQEVARCFTGWTIEDRFLHRRGRFAFDATQHDSGSKTVLGHHISSGGGQSDGEKVLSILASHPSTAQFIARKIVRAFWGDENVVWVKRLSTIFLESGGNIKAMLRPLLESDDLESAPPISKRPFDFVVSALRASNADSDGGIAVQGHLTAMGQPLWGWPMPDGYPDRTSAWTGSLLARWNFALSLCCAQIPGTSVDFAAISPRNLSRNAQIDALIGLFLGEVATKTQLQPLRMCLGAHSFSSSAELGALIFASPAFQWR